MQKQYAQETPDIVCFSHLRWNFVFQRPQHLMVRWARNHRVFYFEEPIFGAKMPHTTLQEDEGIAVIVPHLPDALSPEQQNILHAQLIDDVLKQHTIVHYIGWYYTPMALPYTQHLRPQALVYDCMDELSGFLGAPAALGELERKLCEHADVIFTGGQSLYEAKHALYSHVFAFPSSVDVSHFLKTRQIEQEPSDQQSIPHLRLGFYGVIDERMDLQLVDELAHLRPHWHQIFVGPVVKIDEKTLPHRENIHYLGKKSYQDLPQYLAGWDVAMLPFANNASTRFISPTKTPEYLAGGKPVVSTAIADVVRPYGENKLVHIADTAEQFAKCVELIQHEDPVKRQQRADEFVLPLSWDKTWEAMASLVPVV